jgi:mannose-6-phosphate isomerase-like protein (cupin superfamily)
MKLASVAPRFLSVLSLVAAVSSVSPATGSSVMHVWTHAQIEAQGKALSRKIDAHKLASETIAQDGDTTFIVTHREGTGQAEWHATQADIIVISQGDPLITTGGTIVDGKQVQPGEIRGSGIKGGTQTRLGPGDVVYVPPKTPHMVTLAPGKQVTYFVAKVSK